MSPLIKMLADFQHPMTARKAEEIFEYLDSNPYAWMLLSIEEIEVLKQAANVAA